MTEKLLGNLPQGLVFVLSAPSGTGKTTLVNMLIEEFHSVNQSISCTTRPPRLGEINGKDYFFLTVEEFQDRITKNDFLEYANVFGHWYGTSRQVVQSLQQSGHHVILVIDTQGALKLKDQGFDAIYIFLTPPSFDELKKRLQHRNTEDQATLMQRLSWASHEMSLAKFYDYLVVNQNPVISYGVLRSILISEEHKIRKGHS